MSWLCDFGWHKKYEHGTYEIPAGPGDVTLTQGPNSPLKLQIEIIGAWFYLRDYRCRRCPAKWIGYERVE